jgi:hypothetical protein
MVGSNQGRRVESAFKQAAAEFRFPVSELHLFRSEPNRLNHFVARLDVLKL